MALVVAVTGTLFAGALWSMTLTTQATATAGEPRVAPTDTNPADVAASVTTAAGATAVSSPPTTAPPAPDPLQAPDTVAVAQDASASTAQASATVAPATRPSPGPGRPVTSTTSTTSSSAPTSSPTTIGPTPTTTAAPPPSTTTTAPPPTSGSVVFTDGFGGLPLGLGWPDGSSHGRWYDVFNGFGTSGIVSDGGNVLSEAPATSTSTAETHSALVITQPTFGDLDVTSTYRTVQQLRTPTPNSWEVAWFLWHYTDNVHFYYVLLKPDGWELGKEDPAYPGAQRFLATGSSPRFAIGSTHRVRVVQVGSSISVTADGAPLVRFTDSERPYTSGAVGAYTEDAEAHFASVTVALP